jgi:hypothetical protein
MLRKVSSSLALAYITGPLGLDVSSWEFTVPLIRSEAFFLELERKIGASQEPVVILGDFNLIRRAEDKNNRIINWPRVNLFNECIAPMSLREVTHSLREVTRSGARFTWTNKQLDPVRSVLDRAFLSHMWEQRFHPYLTES